MSKNGCAFWLSKQKKIISLKGVLNLDLENAYERLESLEIGDLQIVSVVADSNENNQLTISLLDSE